MRPNASRRVRCRPHYWRACTPPPAPPLRPWTPPAPCSMRCPPSTSTIWRCGTRRWVLRLPRASPACLWPLGWAAPGYSTTSPSTSEPPPPPTDTRGSARPRATNCLGGIDVTDNAEIQDSPRYGHRGRLALCRVGDHRRRLDGCG